MDRSEALDFAAQTTRLAEQATLGNRVAFGALLRLWHPRLKAFAIRKAGSEGDDVLQMAALTLARNISKLQDPSRFGPWAMTIIARRAADHFRDLHRERDKKTAFAAEPRPSSNDPENQMAQQDHLKKALGQLSAEQRTLLTLHYVEGLSGPEIARLLGLPLGTVKSRLHTGRNRLRSAFDARHPSNLSPSSEGD